ncbi:hypothetical protein LTR85_006332 [Meristemomyces frigidus]|nr:hypothetical protein LTR85_006332 [Meristemomyces frigidus]
MATWRVMVRGVAGGIAAFLLFPAAGAAGTAAGAVTGVVVGHAIPFEKLLGLLANTTVYVGKTVIITVPIKVLKLCAKVTVAIGAAILLAVSLLGHATITIGSGMIAAASLLGQGALTAGSVACSGLNNGISAAIGAAVAVGTGAVSVGSAAASMLGNGAAVASRAAVGAAASAMRGFWSGLKSLLGAFGKGGAFTAGALATLGALGAAVYKWGWPAIREAVIEWVKAQAVAYAPYIATALAVLAIGYVAYRYVYADKSEAETMELIGDEDQLKLNIVVTRGSL